MKNALTKTLDNPMLEENAGDPDRPDAA